MGTRCRIIANDGNGVYFHDSENLKSPKQGVGLWQVPIRVSDGTVTGVFSIPRTASVGTAAFTLVCEDSSVATYVDVLG
jgi:hypothetical protein